MNPQLQPQATGRTAESEFLENRIRMAKARTRAINQGVYSGLEAKNLVLPHVNPALQAAPSTVVAPLKVAS